MSEASALWSTTFAADRIRRYDRAPRIGTAPSCERSLGGYGSPGRCCKEAVEPAPMRLDHFPVRRSVDFLKHERQIGRGSCRERVCQYVSFSAVAGPYNKK